MPRFTFLAIFLLVIALMGCSSLPKQGTAPSPSIPSQPSPGGPAKGLVRSSSGGGVTIDVEWIGEEKGSLLFMVIMDTHSVNLDQYDLGELAVLRDNEEKEYRPSSWSSASGSHHRSGTLTFPLLDSLSQTEDLELVIRGVAGVKERLFQWERE